MQQFSYNMTECEAYSQRRECHARVRLGGMGRYTGRRTIKPLGDWHFISSPRQRSHSLRLHKPLLPLFLNTIRNVLPLPVSVVLLSFTLTTLMFLQEFTMSTPNVATASPWCVVFFHLLF